MSKVPKVILPRWHMMSARDRMLEVTCVLAFSPEARKAFVRGFAAWNRAGRPPHTFMCDPRRSGERLARWHNRIGLRDWKKTATYVAPRW